jgi:hypothetical protein
MLYSILGILLLIIIIQFLPQRREGYTNYNETSCQTLAKQNQDNILSLQADVKKMLESESKLDLCKGQLEANTQQLKLIADQIAAKK